MKSKPLLLFSDTRLEERRPERLLFWLRRRRNKRSSAFPYLPFMRWNDDRNDFCFGSVDVEINVLVPFRICRS